MKSAQKILFAYWIPLGTLFLICYFGLVVRESRLYLLLMVINLPGSLVVVPGVEEAAVFFGWPLGGTVHVWITQLACMAVNGGFFIFLNRMLAKFR